MANLDAKRDNNRVPTLLAVSDSTGEVRRVLVDETTNALKVSGGGGADGSSFTAGSTSSTLMAGVVDDVSTNLVAEDKFGAVRMTTDRAMNINPAYLLTGEDQTNNLIGVKQKPISTNTYSWDVQKSTAYEASRVAKASSGVLREIIGYNSKASAQFIQVHNASSLPADTAVPDLIFTVAATSNFFIDFSDTGYYCSTGIVVCNSSTGPTKTIGAADCWFDVLYK